MAQTSVEWLINELIFKTEYEHLPNNYVLMSDKDIDKIIQQAKEMHKEEIMDAFQAGKWDGYENRVCGAKQFKDPVEYYNETFKTK